MSLTRRSLSRRAVAAGLGLTPLGLTPLALAPLALAPIRKAHAEVSVYQIPPRETDPQIVRFATHGNWVAYNSAASPSAELFVCLPPTVEGGDGFRFDRFQQFFQTATAAGYQVVGLQYDNDPAVLEVCHANPDPACSGNFREKRSFGRDVSEAVNDPPPESIISRLSHLLAYLAAQHPGQGWNRYLAAGGEPNWPLLALGGHSQGAGMAAYIAKQRPVARVVLLSGPEDFYGPERQLAPWIAGPTATPPERWYAMRHAREVRTDLLAQAYVALGIPADHIRVVDLDTAPPPPTATNLSNPFHMSVVGDIMTPKTADGAPAYRPDWAFLLGHSP